MHGGVAPYKPNSMDGGCPFFAGADEGAFVEVPAAVAASTKVRELPATFDDHFSQARLFWQSMTPVEKEHIIRAYTFELGKCYEQTMCSCSTGDMLRQKSLTWLKWSANDAGDSRTFAAAGTVTGVSTNAVSAPAWKGHPPSRVLGL